MKITRIICDICGVEYADHMHTVSTFNGSELDICEGCILNMATTLDVVKPEPKPTKRGRKKAVNQVSPKRKAIVERGAKAERNAKMFALRDSGWSVKDIAVELAVSEQTVYNVLNGDRPPMDMGAKAEADDETADR